MKMQSRSTRYIIAIALVLGLSSIALAEPAEEDPVKIWMRWREKVDTSLKELKLSPEQEQKIAAQRKQQQEQTQELKQKIAQMRKELAEELEQPKPDKSKVYALISEMKELMGKGLEQRVERILMLKEILTPEQMKKLEQKREGFKLKKGGRREKNSRNGAYNRKFGDRDKYARFCQ
ncbi:MAG: periplasmic heavy metal sensor [Candidatus Omnitrophica bacterium]|nr:periplasmic heavy metal sensor [Candidatus Omnitrophota bacterium]